MAISRGAGIWKYCINWTESHANVFQPLTKDRETAEYIALVVPNSMAFRMVVESNIIHLLRRNGTIKIYLLGHQIESPITLPKYVEWRSAYEPEYSYSVSLINRVMRSIMIRVRKLMGWDFSNLAYRFNEIHAFRSHELKKNMPRVRRVREAKAGNFVDPKYARLLPKCKRLYQYLYRVCYSLIFLPHPSIRRFFEKNTIDKVVLWHVQAPLYIDYSWCIRFFKISTIGVLGSWDRPMTKGPICPGISHYVVNSTLMEKELSRYHKIKESQISVVGWPHLDVYKLNETFISEDGFNNKSGFSKAEKIILFATNSPRIGWHEPEILYQLAQSIDRGQFDFPIRLLIRPHPTDNISNERFEKLKSFEFVTLMTAEMGNIGWLANLLKNTDVLISTQGSVTLDAIALDTPTINIAFELQNHLEASESIKWMYEMDHYQPVIKSGGVRVVKSFEELFRAVDNYLAFPEKDAAGRKLLREWQLGPFDGCSSEWMVRAILGRSSIKV